VFAPVMTMVFPFKLESFETSSAVVDEPNPFVDELPIFLKLFVKYNDWLFFGVSMIGGKNVHFKSEINASIKEYYL
jgi:hypothetical protein